MDREDVIRIAKEAGFHEGEFTGGPRKGKVSIFDFGDVDIYSNLKHFAALVAAAERERCAKVCEGQTEGFAATSVWDEAALSCCRAIRALT